MKAGTIAIIISAVLFVIQPLSFVGLCVTVDAIKEFMEVY